MFCPNWDEKKNSKNPVFPTNYPSLQCEKKGGWVVLVNYLKPIQKNLQKLRSSFIKQHHRNCPTEPLSRSPPTSWRIWSQSQAARDEIYQDQSSIFGSLDESATKKHWCNWLEIQAASWLKWQAKVRPSGSAWMSQELSKSLVNGL